MKKSLYRYLWVLTFFVGLLLTPDFVWANSSTYSGYDDRLGQLSIGVFQEKNRTLGDTKSLRIIHPLVMDENYQIQGGLSWNITESHVNALFVDFGCQIINDPDFSINLKFLGNQYPEYDKAANSIIPYFNWDDESYYFSLGLNFRYLNSDTDQLWNIFNYHSQVFERILYYKLGVRHIFEDIGLVTTVEMKNYDEMYAGNLGAYQLYINNELMVSPQVALFVSLGFYQSGSIGLAATSYETTIYWGLEERF